MSDYKQTLRVNYNGMVDEALIDLWNDRHGLTPDAIETLQQELDERQLLEAEEDPATMADFEAARKSLEQRFTPRQMKQLWNAIVDQKIAGKHHATVFNWLMDKDISAEEAHFMLAELPAATLHRINDADHDRMGALIRLCCGVAVIIISMLATLSDLVHFIGWATIVISIVQTAIASTAKSRYVNLLNELINQQSVESEA